MIAIIPARRGSVGIPRKNIKLLNGKPLIQYTIEAAQEVFQPEEIIVSTDDEEIKEYVETLGVKVPFLRPYHLSTETAGMREVILHAVQSVESKGNYPKSVVLLQPTSPLRTAENIYGAIDVYKQESGLDMVASVKEARSNPYYVLKEENNNGYLETSKKGVFVRRQDCPKVWELNGAVYVINVESLKRLSFNEFSKVKKYVMDEESSHDIDEQIDWELAEIYLRKRMILQK